MKRCCLWVATACWLSVSLLATTTTTAFSTTTTTITKTASSTQHHCNERRLSRCRSRSRSRSRYPLYMVGDSEEEFAEEDSDDDDDDDDGFGSISSYNPIEHETPEERKARMKLVRKLQKSFYKDEEVVQANNNDNSSSSSSNNNATIVNLPLWRVQWTELPGSQNVLNVHVPHYTNMFQKLLRGQTKVWGEYDGDDDDDDDSDNNSDNNFLDTTSSSTTTTKSSSSNNNHHLDCCYFGHIFLPGGSENLDNPEYALQEGHVGTLMKICDSRQQPSDGRLTLVVQALEKFEIQSVVRSHSPYAIANVKILLDSEQQQQQQQQQQVVMEGFGDHSKNKEQQQEQEKAAIQQAMEHHDYEYRRVSIDECEIKTDDGTVVGLRVSPLSNYDGTMSPPAAVDNNNNNNNNNKHSSSHDDLAVAESELWIQLDELLKLLRIASNGVGVPVPTQLLGLLPQKRCIQNKNGILQEKDWPSNFGLVQVANAMEKESTIGNSSSSSKTAVVGTYSKSPFVRVDKNNKNEDQAEGNHTIIPYSALRRAQRLSYVVWTLTDSIALPDTSTSSNTSSTSGSSTSSNRYSPEQILQITSTKERLELAKDKMEQVCLLLKKVLRMQG